MENQEMDKFVENRQNYMMNNNSMQHMNVNVASAGCDAVVGGGIHAEVVSGGVAGEILGVKYDERIDEHDVADDEEWKYVKEVQQSEKQQQQQMQAFKTFGLDDDGTFESNELAEKKTTNNTAHDFGNGDGGFVFGGDHFQQQQQQHHDLFSIGNGHDTNGHHDTININDQFGSNISTGSEEKINLMKSEMECFKNEVDFSSFNDESAEGFVAQVDVKIETKPEHQEVVDEEEPSSLATNTTNGTSSLSENVPPQVADAIQIAPFDNSMASLENKENSDPLTPQRPQELDLEQGHSQLNPDAKEFVPSFGSNPSSPTSPFATCKQKNGEPVVIDAESQMYFGQAPTVVPRHLQDVDDLVAESPRKGTGDNNMDAVSVPMMSEFEQEAKNRPHEVEPEIVEDFQQRDEVMTPDQAIQQLPLDDLAEQNKENHPSLDMADFQHLSLIDHGPETSVDLDADLDLQHTAVLASLQEEDDVMKRSIYVASDDAIEEVLNSVQIIPIENDSVNNSFIEESATESAANQLVGDKELLQVEEKEHVSHSPSTEEIQMNLQNVNSSNKDISQIPIDMGKANNMQESIYMEQESQPVHDNQSLEEPYLKSQSTDDLNAEEHHQYEKVELQLEDKFQQETEENLLFEKQIQQDQDNENLAQDQVPEEVVADTNPAGVVDESFLADTTNPVIANDSFLINSSVSLEQQQEIQESFSPFKITDVVLGVSSIAPFNFDVSNDGQHDKFSSYTADEKHLIEETKEQKFTMSGLKQEINEIKLDNSDGHILQAEVAAATATTAIETGNLISGNESVSCDQMLVDDSFNRHELECLKYEQEQEIEQAKEMKDEQSHEVALAQEFDEPVVEQQHQQEQEIEMMVPVEEPVIEAKQTVSLFTNEETEILKETKTEDGELHEDKVEVPSNTVPATAPAELFEPTRVLTPNETETEIEHKDLEHKPHEGVNEPIVKNETTKEEECAKQEVVEIAVNATTLAATAVAVAATAKTPSSPKTETTKKPIAKTTATAGKPKVGSTAATKKPAEAGTKLLGVAAKPRTAPAKPAAATADKKPIAKTTTTITSTASRKPLSVASSTASKALGKTTTTTSTTRTATASAKTTTTSRPTTAPRTVSASNSTIRKTATTSTTTNGPVAKPRPTTAPAKPTTLGLAATNSAAKPKPTSPRAPLTSQVRKTTAGTTSAKSPIKTTTTNGVTKAVSTTLAPKTKTNTSTVSSTAGKTFTARPAPKFTSSSSSTTTTTTTKRLTMGGSTTASSTTTTTKSNSTPLRKSTPTKHATGRTPLKSATTAGGAKSKAAPSTKPATPPAKPAPIRKPVDKTVVSPNVNNNAVKELNGSAEENIIALAEEQKQQQAIPHNGLDLQAVQHENRGDTCIPMQTEGQHQQQQCSLKSSDEQIPMDLINA